MRKFLSILVAFVATHAFAVNEFYDLLVDHSQKFKNGATLDLTGVSVVGLTSGSVTSVGADTSSTGIAITGSPVTTSGTIHINLAAGYVIPTSANIATWNGKQDALGFTPEDVANKDVDGTLSANSDTKYPSQKAVKTYADTKVPKTTTVNSHALSGNISVTASDVGLGSVENAAASTLYVPLTRTVNGHALSANVTVTDSDLGATTIGDALFKLTNPSAITFPQFNADNTVSALSASAFRTAIGAGTSSFSGLFTSLDFTSSNLTSVATRNFSALQNIPTTRDGYGLTDVPKTVEVSKFATGGSGTSGSPWTGWDTAITWTANTRYHFGAGTYSFATAFNAGKTGLRLSGDGQQSILKFTGTGVAINMTTTGTDNTTFAWDVGAENLMCVGNANATDFFFLNKVHHIYFKNVRGKDFTGQLIHTQFVVSGILENIVVSGNELGYPTTTFGTQPQRGLFFSVTGVGGEITTDIVVVNPIIERVSGYGITLDQSQGISVIGGTSEGNAGGIEIGPGSQLNRVDGCDFEVNSTADITINANYNSIVNCVAASAVGINILGGTGNTIQGGYIPNITNNGVGTTILDSNGNLGLGRTPVVNLDIQGPGIAQARLKRGNNSADASIAFEPTVLTSGSPQWAAGIKGNDSGYSVYTWDGTSTVTDRFTIDTNGNAAVKTGSLLINNSQYYRIKDSGGTQVNAVGILNTNDLQFVSGVGGNIIFAPNAGNQGVQMTLAATTGDLTVSGSGGFGSLILQGNQSAAAWTTNGIRLKGISGTLTDTTSSGTVAAAYTNKLGGNTIAASSATTFTNYISSYFSDPVAGTNVTLTNKWGLGADSLYVGTSNPVKITSAGVLTATSPVLTTPDLGTPSAATLTSATGLPISTGVSGLGSGIATWLATPTEANLKSAQSGLAWLDTAQTFTATQTMTSPKIVTSLADTNNNSMLAFTATASAVDGFTFTNAATANPATVTMAGTGGDSNISIALTPKGTGTIKLSPTVSLGATTSTGNEVNSIIDIKGVEPRLNYGALLNLEDTSSIAAGIGARILLGSTYQSNNYTGGVALGASKDNATSGNYGFSFHIGTRPNGGNITDALWIGSDQGVTIGPSNLTPGAGNLSVSGTVIGGVQSLSGAGAVNITTLSTAFTSTGNAQALTLANGAAGQIKTIAHVVDGGSGVLTPTTKSGYSTITFTNVGDSVTLQFFTTAGWCVIGSYGVTIAP